MNTYDLAKIGLPETNSELRLRHWNLRDAGCVQSASRDPNISSVTSIEPNCGDFLAADWIKRQLQKVSGQTDLPLCIATSDNDEALGMIGIFGIANSLGIARCGYWIAPGFRGKNYSGKALKIITVWAFEALGLKTLELFIDSQNIASIKAAEFAGYHYDREQSSEIEIKGSHPTMKVFICQCP